MTFGNIIRVLQDGQAAKPATFNGYAYRESREKADFSSSTDYAEFSMKFKKRDDSDSADDDEIFIRVLKDRNTMLMRYVPKADESGMSVNGDLFKALTIDDWAIARKEDFEATRTGEGKVW